MVFTSSCFIIKYSTMNPAKGYLKGQPEQSIKVYLLFLQCVYEQNSRNRSEMCVWLGARKGVQSMW